MNSVTTIRDRNHLEVKSREFLLWMFSFAMIVAGGAFLHLIGQYALVGRHPFQFFADSNTYHDIYSGFIPSPGAFIGVNYNYLGPLVILSATGGNIYLIMAVNVFIFTISMIYICRALDIDPVRSALIQFLSPMLASSLLFVNKEILIFPVLALLINGYRYRSITLVVLAIFVSILARWQLTVFCVILIGMYTVRNANRYVVLSSLLVAISLAYYLAQSILEPVLENVESSITVFTEGSGFFERLLDLQNDGLYFIVGAVKSAHLLFSMGLHFEAIIHPINIYNDQIIGLYCFVNIVFFVMLFVKRRFSVNNELIAISLVYLIVFALTPVYAPRYFYAVTVLWGLALAGGRGLVAPAPARSTAQI